MVIGAKGCIGRAKGRREQFDVYRGLGTMTHCSANAIIARVATTYDNDVLASGVDIIAVCQFGIEKDLVFNCDFVTRNFRIGLNISDNEMSHTSITKWIPFALHPGILRS